MQRRGEMCWLPDSSGSLSDLFFVYILQSLTTQQFHVGHCYHLIERFREHQSGVDKATRGRGPWWMPYYEIYGNITDAEMRENEIKSHRSSRYIRTIIYDAFPLIELE